MWASSVPRGVSDSAWQDALSAKGPVIITVHGTGSGLPSDEGKRWWQRGSDFLDQVTKGVEDQAGVRPTILPFHWTGANSDFDRFAAAKGLRAVLIRLKRRKKPIALLAHSHGGNVVHYALRYFWPMFARYVGNDSVVSYGTPFLARNRKFLNVLVLTFNLIAAMAITAALVNLTLTLPYALPYRPESVLFASLILLLAPCLYMTWRYGVRYAVSWLAFRIGRVHARRNWLSVRSLFDEPVALLGGVRLLKLNFVPRPSMRRSILTLLTSVDILASGAVLMLTPFLMAQYFYFGDDLRAILVQRPGAMVPAMHYGPLSVSNVLAIWHAVLSEPAARQLAWSYQLSTFFAIGLVLVFAVYVLLYLVSLVLAWMASGPAAWFVNRGVVGVINGSALGQDHDYRIHRAVAKPSGLAVKELLIDTETLGPVTSEDRRNAAERIYQSLSRAGGIEQMAADPIGVWNELNAVLYHNAYFADQRVIDATVAHLVESWRHTRLPFRGAAIR